MYKVLGTVVHAPTLGRVTVTAVWKTGAKEGERYKLLIACSAFSQLYALGGGYGVKRRGEGHTPTTWFFTTRGNSQTKYLKQKTKTNVVVNQNDLK